MKTTQTIRRFACLLTLGASLTLSGFAADQHATQHKTAPKGGRLLDRTQPQAELVVEQDRTVTINFYDANMKPAAATTQQVTVYAEAKDGKTKVEFAKKGDGLVSQAKLPEGERYNVIVQFKQSAEAKPQNFRFKLDLHICGGCQRAEYACTCDH